MSWRDELYLEGRGSFRDAEFFVSKSESSLGRRSVIEEYPGRDLPGTQDLGRSARKFSFDAYVLGVNYMRARRALEDALEAPGPGPLVHPYRGKMQVVVSGDVKVIESPDEGGMARFSITVVQVSVDGARLAVRPDPAAAVDAAATAVVEAATEELEERFSVSGFAAGVSAPAIERIGEVTSLINEVAGDVAAAMNVANDLAAQVQAVADAAQTLINLPGQLASQLDALMLSLFEVVDTLADAVVDAVNLFAADARAPAVTSVRPERRSDLWIEALRKLLTYGTGLETITETTPQREQEAENQAALVDGVQALALAEAARSAINLEFSSAAAALAALEEHTAAVDALMEHAGDTLYSALADLKVAMSRYMREAASRAPRTTTYTPGRTLPALLLAQLLYGDATLADDIVLRNNVRNPCRVPAGETLEVLADG